MFSIIGSVIGFLGSIVPNLLKLWQDKKDKEHELAILNIQIERDKLGFSQKMEEINVQADIAEMQALYQSVKPIGVTWVDALIGTVRPIITYSFFGLYAFVKVQSFITVDSHSPYYITIWSDMDQVIFCTIISFWFGSRTFQKLYKK